MVSNLKKKRGKEGNAVLYATRNQALQRLQLRLPEFRRLCILKGVHPREPRKKVSGQNKTYYHVKDIAFLAHEPLLLKFREARAHSRKVRRAKAKGQSEAAARLVAAAPSYRLDSLVRERYPSLGDALRDLADPLTLLHLFAVLPAERQRGIPVERVHAARSLSLAFQAYVALTGSLRKAFVSVKGIYCEARVCGETVHWLVPHALTQLLPADVDYRVMLTFLEFDEALLGFVNFRLFHSLQLPYPPPAGEGGGEGPRFAPLFDALAAAKGEAALSELRQAGEEEASALFRGLVFSLGRETHTELLSFIALACGGQLAAPGHPSVTHAVVDRPAAAPLPPGALAVQPQWLFDSLNFRLRCPEAPYAPGQLPPPHLSPFVDNAREGHVPDFAETVAEWQAAARGAAVARLADAGDEPAAAAADGGAYAAELAAEFAGVPYSAAGAAAEEEEAEEAPRAPRAPPAQQTEGEEEAEAAVLSHVLLPRKQKELYKAMTMGRAKKAERSAALKAKVKGGKQ